MLSMDKDSGVEPKGRGDRFPDVAKYQLDSVRFFAGSFGTTKKPGLSGSSDTRSTPENDNKIPEHLVSACHQLWGQWPDSCRGP